MAKNPALQEFVDMAAKACGFKPENKAKGLCVKCGEHALDRIHTLAGVREFQISGLCEVCWDEMFAEPEPGGSTEEDLVRAQKGES